MQSKQPSNTRSSLKISRLFLGASLFALAPLTTAYSQDSVSSGVDQVIVYGEKREQNLQDTEISITAIQDDLLQRGNITDASGLNGYVPGLLVTDSGGSERIISIRGVGSGTPENFFSQPGVSFHIDGAYIPNAIALNMGFFDVDRVEVLRGPQGTVFGQSATGGAINVITKQPNVDEVSGEVSATVGNFGYVQSYGAINYPLSDTFAVRGSFQTHDHEGYAVATAIPGIGEYELDDASNRHFRAAALWTPIDDLSVTLSATTYNDNHNGSALKNILDPDPDPRRLTQDYPATFELESDLFYVKIEYELPFATFKSVSSFQDLKHDQAFEADRLDIANFGGYDHVSTWGTDSETWMQEATLTSNSDGRLEWIAGFFFTSFKSEQYINEFAERNVTALGAAPVLPSDLPASQVPSNIAYANLATVDRTSWAPFFQASFDITDKLSATIGARYNDDTYSGFSEDFFGAFGPATTRDFEGQTWTGKAAVSYDLTDDNSVYLSFARGYKPGGSNPAAVNSLATPETFEEEIVETLELGSKNLFFDNRLMLNSTLFYSFYDNMHYIQEDGIPFSGGTGNIPESEVWGFELEGALSLLEDRLLISGNMALLDGEVKSEFLALDRRLADIAGDEALANGTAPFPWSFPWFLARASAATQVLGNEPVNLSNTYRLAATWVQPVADFGEISGTAEFIATGEYQARIFNTPGADETPGYEQLNFNLFFEPEDMPWTMAFSVINALDEAGINGRFVDPYSSGQVSNEFIAPRQFLVTLNVKF